MSATIHKLPEPTYRPNFEGLFKVIDQRTGDRAYLIGLAELGIRLVINFQDRSTPDDDVTPAECQKIMNAIARPRLGRSRRSAQRAARHDPRR